MGIYLKGTIRIYYQEDMMKRKQVSLSVVRMLAVVAASFLVMCISAFVPGDVRANDKREAEQLVDDFFEQEIRNGFERLGQMTDLIEAQLAKGEKLEVLIKGFTSPRAETAYNLNLGKRRISSVRNHFENWSDGALRPYLKSGQLQITEISFGETTARSGISDRLSDERNSIYHPDAARERRVEIVEIRNQR